MALVSSGRFLRLAPVAQRSPQVAAAVAGIAFAAVMVTFQLGLYEALTEGAVIVHRSLRGDLMMISRQYEFIAINKGFTERRLEQARALPG